MQNGATTSKTRHLSYAVTTLTGRVFVAVLFAYLFALVISLYEAHSFQDLARTFVGNDKAQIRTALNAVRDAQEAEKRTPKPNPELVDYAELAVRIDISQRALQQLQQFDVDRDITHMGFVDGMNSPERQFVRIFDELQQAVSGLPSAQFAQVEENLSTIQQKLDEIQQNSTLDKLLLPVVLDVEAVRTRFDEYRDSLGGDSSADTVEAERFSDLKNAVDTLAERKNPLTVQLADLEAVEQRMVKTKLALNDIADSIAQISPGKFQSLANNEQNLGLLNSITQPIAKMESAAFELKGLEVKLGDVAEGESERDELASTFAADVAEYDQAKATLSTAISELEKVLSGLDPTARIAHALGGEHKYSQANAIWRSFLELRMFESFVSLNGLLVTPQVLATFGGESLNLILVFAMGAIGSLIYITKDQLRRTIQGQRLTDPPERPLSWFLFRPVFGMVVAFAIYLLYKAGQIALGSGSNVLLAASVNIPVLSIISLFAGLLSWQALDTVEAKGQSWLRNQERRNLWATGLGHALQASRKSAAELGEEIGRTEKQVERWISCVDIVMPELQDRISTKLQKPIQELFSDSKLPDATLQIPLWGTGLRGALNGDDAPDTRGLAAVLETPYAQVQKWVELDEQVPYPAQWQIVEILGRSHTELFSTEQQGTLWWGVGMRDAMLATSTSAIDLAKILKTTPEEIRGWMELYSPVDGDLRRQIAASLNRKGNMVFKSEAPTTAQFAVGLREAIRKSREFQTPETLAEALDTNVSYVDDWLDLARPLYQGTVNAMADLLGPTSVGLFSPKGPSKQESQTALPALEQSITDRFNGNTAEFAKAVFTSSERLESWLVGDTGIAQPTRKIIVEVLNDKRPNTPLLETALFADTAMSESERSQTTDASQAPANA